MSFSELGTGRRPSRDVPNQLYRRPKFKLMGKSSESDFIGQRRSLMVSSNLKYWPQKLFKYATEWSWPGTVTAVNLKNTLASNSVTKKNSKHSLAELNEEQSNIFEKTGPSLLGVCLALWFSSSKLEQSRECIILPLKIRGINNIPLKLCNTFAVIVHGLHCLDSESLEQECYRNLRCWRYPS